MVSIVKCLRKWDNVCKDKIQGALGIKSICDQDIALLGKWLWKVMNDSILNGLKCLKSGCMLEGN